MDALLYIGLIPITVGGLAMYLKLKNVPLRILGLILFGAGLLLYACFPRLYVFRAERSISIHCHSENLAI